MTRHQESTLTQCHKFEANLNFAYSFTFDHHLTLLLVDWRNDVPYFIKNAQPFVRSSLDDIIKWNHLHKVEPMRDEIKRNSKSSTKFCMYRSISRSVLCRKRPGPRTSIIDNTANTLRRISYDSDHPQKPEEAQVSFQRGRRRRRPRRCLVTESMLKRDCQLAVRQLINVDVLESENIQTRKKCRVDTNANDNAKKIEKSVASLLDECTQSVKNLSLYTASSDAASRRTSISEPKELDSRK